MKAFFIELFDYNTQVNRLTIQRINADSGKSNYFILRSLNHILLAHRTWNLRMKHEPGLTELWEGIEISRMETYNDENALITLEILSSLDESISGKFHYTNSKGILFESNYRDVLFYLINHSTYHRSQVNLEIRKIGIEPVVNDFVFYKR